MAHEPPRRLWHKHRHNNDVDGEDALEQERETPLHLAVVEEEPVVDPIREHEPEQHGRHLAA